MDIGGGMVLYFPVRRESGEAHNLSRTPASTLDYCAMLIRASQKLHPKSEFFIYEVTTDGTGRSLAERLLPNEQVSRLLDSNAA